MTRQESLLKVRNGFSLLEILIVLAFIGLLFGLARPRLGPATRNPVALFAENLNRALAVAYSNAVLSGRVHRVYFDLQKKSMSVDEAHSERDSFGALKFSPLRTALIKRNVPIDGVTIRTFFIGGKDELKQGADKDVWLLVTPQGYAQDVRIGMVRDATGQNIEMTINPFLCTAQVSSDEAT